MAIAVTPPRRVFALRGDTCAGDDGTLPRHAVAVNQCGKTTHARRMVIDSIDIGANRR